VVRRRGSSGLVGELREDEPTVDGPGREGEAGVDAGLGEHEPGVDTCQLEQRRRQSAMASKVAASKTVYAAGGLATVCNLVISSEAAEAFAFECLLELRLKQSVPGGRQSMMNATAGRRGRRRLACSTRAPLRFHERPFL
jgi:hypothetical protein